MGVALRIPAAERAYLAAAVDRLSALLGAALVAVYPMGSLALDGYVPGRSDIDLMVITDPAPTRATLRAVAAQLPHHELPCPATGLELVLYPRSVAAAGTLDAGYLLDLNTGRELP